MGHGHGAEADPRVVVIGSSCAGKSTFARELASARGCAFIEMDDLFWAGNWVPKPAHEFLAAVEAASAPTQWVVAGNYGSARDVLWPRATTIVWLNYSLPRVLGRGLVRTVRRVVTREVLFQGNRETFRRSFLSRDSILWWIVTTFHRRQHEFESLRASGRYAQLRWIEVRHPDQAAAAMQWLRAHNASPAPCNTPSSTPP